ncbi:unnamed protein product [Lactuca saligna]|uniref:phosphoribosylglycinamide formyltransferase 1 n=1 Tax=Lactuca saligna TaxID=75948 RepID=A0AA35ZK02_LACSI|nr:unnamed protein product [Lactuca saligna]
MFDANYDTLVRAIQKNGFTNIGIIVGEIGCQSDGDRNTNNQLAQWFMQGFCEMPLIQREGTNFLPPARIFIAKTLRFDLKFKRVSINVVPFFIINLICKGYYGRKVHKAIIASGARYLGPTIHFVDENYDTDQILVQRIVPVVINYTAEELAARVLRQEHKMYAEVAAAICEERVI